MQGLTCSARARVADVAALLNAISHPDRALFETLVSGSAAVAMASVSAQHAGGAALSGTEALKLIAKSGASSVANKYTPAEGSVAHGFVTAASNPQQQQQQQDSSSSSANQVAAGTAKHMAASRAAGAPVQPLVSMQHAAEAHVASGVNSAASQAIRAYTGLNIKPNFSPQELKSIANAIKPSDVQKVGAQERARVGAATARSVDSPFAYGFRLLCSSPQMLRIMQSLQ